MSLWSRLVLRSNLNVWTFSLLFWSQLTCLILLRKFPQHSRRDLFKWWERPQSPKSHYFSPVAAFPDSVSLTQCRLSQILCLQHSASPAFTRGKAKQSLQKHVCLCPRCFCIVNARKLDAAFWPPGRKSEGSHFRGGWFYHITDQLDLFKLVIFMVSIDNAQHVYIHIICIAS